MYIFLDNWYYHQGGPQLPLTHFFLSPNIAFQATRQPKNGSQNSKLILLNEVLLDTLYMLKEVFITNPASKFPPTPDKLVPNIWKYSFVGQCGQVCYLMIGCL